MTDTPDIEALVAKGKKAALSAEHDDCLLLSDLADALERAQAVVGAAQRYTKLYDEAESDPEKGKVRWGQVMGAVVDIRRAVKDLAALDAPLPEGDGTKGGEDGR